MKKLSIIAIPLVLGLWAGYALGYHQGTCNEERAWLSTAPAGPDNNDAHIFCYRNPHTGPFYEPLNPRAVNVPDPRVCERHGRSSD